MLDSQAAMTTFLNLVAAEPDISRVPVMIDSSKWSVIEAGLKCVQGKPVVNSISLKEGEAEFVRQARLARRYGAAVVVMAFDEKGQADTLERRTEICGAAYDILVERRWASRAEDIIFDPNIFAVATGLEEHANYGVDFIEATRWIRQNLPHVKISRRRVEPVVLVPRQRPGARGDAHRVPLPRDPGRHDDGHRQRRAARRLRGDPEGPARARRGRDPQPAAAMRPSGWWSSPRRSRPAASAIEEDLAVAQGHGRGAPRARAGARASRPGSSRTPRRRGRRPSGRSR